MEKSVYLTAALVIIIYLLGEQVRTYHEWVPKLLWSVDTLYLNVVANREEWRACKRFKWCDEVRRKPPHWTPVARGETRWEA